MAYISPGYGTYLNFDEEMIARAPMFFDIHEKFLGPDHVARQTTEEGRKLQSFHYECKKKKWDWDKYVTLHKEQHTIMNSMVY